MAAQTIDPTQKTQTPALPEQIKAAELNTGVRAIGMLSRAGLRGPAVAGAQSLASRAAQFDNPAASEIVQPTHEPTEPASWELNGWSGRTLPLGIAFDGSGIELDPAHQPNLVVASTTDGGKTMRALRPIAAEFLASGGLLLLANVKGGDFAPFAGHPNLIRVPGEALEVCDLLGKVLGEVRRRNDILEQNGVSTYYRMGPSASTQIGPKVMVMIDEIVSMIYGAEPDVASKIWRQTINITSKCRAMGIMVVLAGTDITYRLGKDWLAVRANCARMAFRMLDPTMSRALLDISGAENLTGAQFIARISGNPVRGVAFHPQDQDVENFLAKYRVNPLPRPAFLEAPQVEPEVSQKTNNEEKQILELARQGKSTNEIARMLFGYSGGAAFTRVKMVLDRTTRADSVEFDPAPAM